MSAMSDRLIELGEAMERHEPEHDCQYYMGAIVNGDEEIRKRAERYRFDDLYTEDQRRDTAYELLEAIDKISKFCEAHLECKTCELKPLCGELNNCVKCFCYAANQANRDNKLKKSLNLPS